MWAVNGQRREENITRNERHCAYTYMLEQKCMELLFYYFIGEAVPVTSSTPQETVETPSKDCTNADEAQPSSAKLADGKTQYGNQPTVC